MTRRGVSGSGGELTGPPEHLVEDPRGGLDASPWEKRVRVVEATADGPWELPVIGAIPPPAAALIRPDGHVAWAGEPGDPELPRAVATWF